MPIAVDKRSLLKSALAMHDSGQPLLAAEILRRVLMSHPGTPEARIAVHYLTEGLSFPSHARELARQAGAEP